MNTDKSSATEALANNAESLLTMLEVVNVRGLIHDLPDHERALLLEELVSLNDCVREFRAEK